MVKAEKVCIAEDIVENRVERPVDLLDLFV